MPMIDIYAVAGTFKDTKKLAIDAASAVKSVEQVPDIPNVSQEHGGFRPRDACRVDLQR